MPDYNPAVAAGIQPPQSNFAGTLGAVTTIQENQARMGLYNLQAAQQMRQFNALQAAAAAYRNNQDPVDSYLSNGGDPSGATAMQTLFANQRAMAATPNHVLPAQQNELAAYPGAVAKSQQEQIGVGKARTEADAAVAKQYGTAVLINPSDDGAWHQLVTKHAQASGMNDVETQAALKIKDPQMRTDAAIRYGAAANVPVQELAQTFKMQGDTDTNDYNNTSLTPAQRVGAAPILRQPGEVAKSKSQGEKQGAYFSNLYSGVSAAGNTAASARDEINIAKSVINDPQFYSGTGEHINLYYKRALASFGIDPGASLPQEAFRKVMAQNILNQVTGLREAQEQIGGAGSRIFQSQIELMEKAAQNPDNSIAANRFLTELADRSSQRNIKIADMAANYKGGTLDSGFEKQLRDYTSKNPLFSNAELAHPKTIGMDPRERDYLKTHPEMAPQFDSYYGKGASDAVLGK